MDCDTPSRCTTLMGLGCSALTTLTVYRMSRATTINIDFDERWSSCLTTFGTPINCSVIFLMQSSEHATKRECRLNLMPKT